MTDIPHPHHGAFLSELRSLGFRTVIRRSAVTGHLASAAWLDRGNQRSIVLPPLIDTPGMILRLDRANRMMSANWSVPAACFSDVVREHVTGAEGSRMHGPDCECTHPDGA